MGLVSKYKTLVVHQSEVALKEFFHKNMITSLFSIRVQY